MTDTPTTPANGNGVLLFKRFQDKALAFIAISCVSLMVYAYNSDKFQNQKRLEDHLSDYHITTDRVRVLETNSSVTQEQIHVLQVQIEELRKGQDKNSEKLDLILARVKR